MEDIWRLAEAVPILRPAGERLRRRPRNLCTAHDDSDGVWVQPHELAGLIVNANGATASSDGRSCRVKQERTTAPRRRPVLRRRFPHRSDLCIGILVVVVEICLARDELRIAFGIGWWHEHSRVDILLGSLDIKDVTVELLAPLAHPNQRHVDREESCGDLELHKWAKVLQFEELFLHFDQPLLSIGEATVGAVEIVSLVDCEHELDGLCPVPQADAAGLVD